MSSAIKNSFFKTAELKTHFSWEIGFADKLVLLRTQFYRKLSFA